MSARPQRFLYLYLITILWCTFVLTSLLRILSVYHSAAVQRAGLCIGLYSVSFVPAAQHSVRRMEECGFFYCVCMSVENPKPGFSVCGCEWSTFS